MRKLEFVQQTTLRIFLLFLIISGIFVAINVPIALSTSWGLTGWGYRKSTVVNGSTGAGSDYQITLVVFFGSGTDNASHVYCDSACKSDFGDIRFTEDDGTTELDYWMETLNDGVNATFWVEISDSLETDVTIYMYYGNPAVSTTSDFSNTMNTANPSITFDHHPSAYGFPPTQFNTEHNSANTLEVDSSWGYMNSTDSWTQNMEGCYWIYDFGSTGGYELAVRRFFAKWYHMGNGYQFPPYYTVWDTSIYVTAVLADPQYDSTWTKIAGYTGGIDTGQVNWTTPTFTNSTTGAYRYVKVEQKTTPGSLIIWGKTFVDGVWATKYVAEEPTPISWSEVEEEPEEPPPEPEPGPLTLTVVSNPEQGQEFTWDGTAHNTPYSGAVNESTSEYFVNGGFETGDFTGWDPNADPDYPFTINSEMQLTGNFCAQAYDVAVYGDVEEQIINGGFENTTLEIWDDFGTSFWTPVVDVILTNDNNSMQHGVDCLNITTLASEEIHIYHDYDDEPLDFSGYVSASLWIYGWGNSDSMRMYFGSDSYDVLDNYFMYEFNDSIEGWNLYQFNFSLFNATGTPSWTSIRLIYMWSYASESTILIDYLTIEGIPGWSNDQWVVDNDTYTGSRNVLSQLGLTCDISQDFLLPIAVSTMTSFGFWAKCNPLGSIIQITCETLPNEEDSETMYHTFVSSDYEYVDLLESIPGGVIAIFSIEIHYQDNDYLARIDDVSLIGSTYDSSGFVGDINQYFSTPIRSDTITSFGWQMRSTYQSEVASLWVGLGILGEEPLEFDFNVSDIYEYINMSDYITGNSTAYITYIWLSYNGVWGRQLYIDDFSLQATTSSGSLIELSTTESQHRNCVQYYFQEWQINGTFYSTNLTIIFSMSSNTTVTIVFSYFSDEYAFGSGWIQLNSDSDFSEDSLTDDAYYNPHLYGDIDTWSIDFTDYMTLMVDSVSVDSGHIAAGTWYYNWTAISETQPDRIPLNNTFILDTDVRIRALNYTDGAWLRVAFAAAFCDRYNTSGYGVKYTELDIYDNPLGALNSSSGDAVGGGNVIYQGQDVVEFRVANVSVSDTWSHFTWNLTQYINAAWGDMVANNEFKLESVYCVIEVIGDTKVTVDVDNFKLFLVNDTSWQTPYSYWDGVASEVKTDVEEAKWSTVFRNSTGYSIYSTIYNTDWNVGTPYVIALDDLDTFFTPNTNGTATLTLTDVETPKVEGDNATQIDASIPDAEDYAYFGHSWGGESGDDWSAYEFLCFYMRFNTTDLFHRISLIDNTGNSIKWQIKDVSDTRYHNTSYNSGYNLVILPLKRPEIVVGGTFNLSAVRTLNIVPCYTYENGTYVYEWEATIYLDAIWLDVGKDVTVFYNVPLGNSNFTLLTKRDITGYMGQYVPAITSITGIVDADNFWVLRPKFDTAFGTWGLYNTTADANNGLSMYGTGSQGTYVNVLYGESHASVLIPSGYAPCKKIAVRLRLPPKDGLATVNGTIEQEYVWGGISETKVCLYVENAFPVFGDAIITNLDLDGWVFAEKRMYQISANLTLPDGKLLSMMMFNFTDAFKNTMGVYFNNITSSVDVFGSSGEAETLYTFLATNNNSLSFQWNHNMISANVPFWVKRYVADTWAVDLGMFVNDTDTTGSNTSWFIVQSDYFNIYSQGGLEKITVSGNAGRLQGGEEFNLYAGNASYALSEMYWLNLAHVKFLITVGCTVDATTTGIPWLTWPNTFESQLQVQIGIDYYANGQWFDTVNAGPSIIITINGGFDNPTDKYSLLTATFSGAYGDQFAIYVQEIRTFYTTNTPYMELWVDMWINKANASSVFGERVGSYFYPMSNHDFWNFIGIGSFAQSYQNVTEASAFSKLKDNVGNLINFKNLELEKLWVKVSNGGADGENYTMMIKSIKQFDLTFSSERVGISTPTFEEPRTPQVPLGGMFGVLASWLSSIMGFVGTAFSFVWSGVIWILDGILQSITGQAGVFTSFVNMIVSVVLTVVSFMGMIVSYFWQFTLVFSNLVTLFFTYFFSAIWGVFSFIFTGAFNIWTAIATIFGISIAWLTGGTYVNGWGQTYNFTHMYNFTFMGLHGGISIFMIFFVVGFFIQILRCVTTMSLGPIMEPIGLFWSFVQFLMKIVEFIFDLVMRLIHTLVSIAHALRDIAPRPFGL